MIFGKRAYFIITQKNENCLNYFSKQIYYLDPLNFIIKDYLHFTRFLKTPVY